jgi:hypothetical protein
MKCERSQYSDPSTVSRDKSLLFFSGTVPRDHLLIELFISAIIPPKDNGELIIGWYKGDAWYHETRGNPVHQSHLQPTLDQACLAGSPQPPSC